MPLRTFRTKVYDPDMNCPAWAGYLHARATDCRTGIVDGVHCPDHQVVWGGVEHARARTAGERVVCCLARVNHRRIGTPERLWLLQGDRFVGTTDLQEYQRTDNDEKNRKSYHIKINMACRDARVLFRQLL